MKARALIRRYYEAMARHRRRRFLVVLTVVFSLLFQQVALAAYSCVLDTAPPPLTAHCAEMAMTPDDEPDSALCQKHCAPDVSVLTPVPAQDVPALLLPSDFPFLRAVAAAPLGHCAEVPVARSDPPPRLRYCSLQI